MLGAAWIDARYVEQFLRQTLDDPQLRVEHPGGQIWAVRGNPASVLASSTWGTDRYPAPQLAQALCEQRKIEVRDLIRSPDGDRSVPNVDATLAAQEKAAELAEHFAAWTWQDPARTEDLARTYNERFNNLVLRSYDNTTLSLPSPSLAFRPRPHQVAAVARMIHESAVLPMRADFQSADLKLERFERCDLTGAQFSNAEMDGTYFSDCMLYGINGVLSLKGAIVRARDAMALVDSIAAAIGIHIDDS